jgi:ferredoxin-NADP reductase
MTPRCLHSLLLLLSLFRLATSETHHPDNNHDCASSEYGECGLSEDDKELREGLNAMPARIAVVSGQVPDLQMCGEWCQEEVQERGKPGTPCRMDTAFVPCKGNYHCTTTCALWHRSILLDPLNGFDAISKNVSDERPRVTCPMFKRFDGFVSSKTSEVCDTACLLPEIRPHRYPAPTGLGLTCQIGTCNPVSVSVGDAPPARLECPCNWFGSDCDDDWFSIQNIQHTATFGGGGSSSRSSTMSMATTITLSKNDWEIVMKDHQPGGVIRVTRRDPESGHVHEQPYAVASASAEQGTLEILTTGPDQTLDRVVRDVAEHVRGFPLQTVTTNPSNLFVNPTIAGFFNSNWQFLLEAMTRLQIEHVMVISTGTGLSGALSALESILPLLVDDESLLSSVHLYHGVRTVKELPYQELLETYLQSVPQEQFRMTIVESRGESDGEYGDSMMKLSPGIQDSIESGASSKRQLLEEQQQESSSSKQERSTKKSKVYVQNIVEHDLTSTRSNKNLLKSAGLVTLDNTVFVVCGRLALLEDTEAMLKRVFCDDDDDSSDVDACRGKVGPHFFTNI